MAGNLGKEHLDRLLRQVDADTFLPPLRRYQVCRFSRELALAAEVRIAQEYLPGGTHCLDANGILYDFRADDPTFD